MTAILIRSLKAGSLVFSSGNSRNIDVGMLQLVFSEVLQTVFVGSYCKKLFFPIFS